MSATPEGFTRTYDAPGHPLHGLPLLRRGTGLLEAICEHGVGHPIPESVEVLAKHYRHEPWVWEQHGCCGCCEKGER